MYFSLLLLSHIFRYLIFPAIRAESKTETTVQIVLKEFTEKEVRYLACLFRVADKILKFEQPTCMSSPRTCVPFLKGID